MSALKASALAGTSRASTELILKALYLKNGYAINWPKSGNKTLKFPFTLKEAAGQR
jgi:hypothetical protein